jgi:heptose-I-phosphate ethanolaminephosphotransferase
MFLSDHGEELYEYRDHAGHGIANKATSEIPFFAMLSPGFKKNYPAIDAVMKQRTNTPYSSANNFYTLLHLLNINSKKHERKILKNAFFSPRYDSTGIRLVMGIDYSTMNP